MGDDGVSTGSTDEGGGQHRHEPLNVRGELVGHEGAEELEIEDNRTTALATLVLGVLLIVVAVATLTQAASLSNNGNAVGPATAPWIVGSLLLIVSVLMTVRGRSELAAAAREHTPGHQTSPQDWKRLGILLVALVVFAAVNPFLGYVVSATILFAITAIALGAADRLKAFAYGFIVASVVFLLFDVLIGITLPAGIWGF